MAPRWVPWRLQPQLPNPAIAWICATFPEPRSRRAPGSVKREGGVMTFVERSSLEDGVQVYTFAGFVEGDADLADPATIRTGLARAISHDQVVRQMAEWGFKVTAISALTEVRETLAVLEAIAAGTAEVDPSDYLDFLDATAPHSPAQVFAMSGFHAGAGPVFAGFALAPSAERLTVEMARLKFQVQTCASLADLRQLAREMSTAREDDEGVIDLVGHQAAA